MNETTSGLRPPAPKYLVRCIFQHTPETHPVVVYYGTFDLVVDAVEYLAFSEAQGCEGEHSLLTEDRLPVGCRIVGLVRARQA